MLTTKRTHPFVCDDGMVIAAIYVCDGVTECSSNEDEKYCSSFYNIIFPSQMCIEISSMNLSNFDWFCPNSVNRLCTVIDTMHYRQISSSIFPVQSQ